MVFDLLGQSVFDFLKANQFQPLPPEQIVSVGRQLLTSVKFMHKIRMVHTDLKPENILFTPDTKVISIPSSASPLSRFPNRQQDDPTIMRHYLKNPKIQLIDFGSAVFESEYHAQIVSTRHYRAPEVIVGARWSYPCDMWSIGCILAELWTGDTLFQTHENLEHLKIMERILGPFPERLIRHASRQGSEYFRHGHVDYPRADTTEKSRYSVASIKALLEIVPPSQSWFTYYFYDLLRRMLEYDPDLRITAEEALNHEFFRMFETGDDGYREVIQANTNYQAANRHMYTSSDSTVKGSGGSALPGRRLMPDLPLIEPSHRYSLRETRFQGNYYPHEGY